MAFSVCQECEKEKGAESVLQDFAHKNQPFQPFHAALEVNIDQSDQTI